MWQHAGAEVVDMAVDERDAVLAATVICLTYWPYTGYALAASGSAADIFRFAAGGFRDFTRIASSERCGTILCWRTAKRFLTA